MATITLEQLLESVSDAISVLVLFAAEAGNNTAVLKNLATGAQGVQAAVTYFAGQADATVGKWAALGSDDMAAKMKFAADGLKNCVNGIAEACMAIQKEPKNPTPKSTILEESKDLLKWMVSVIQFNDLYDVMLALKKDLLEGEMATFQADDYVLLLGGIQESLQRREDANHDSRTRQLLREANEEIGQLKVPFCTLVKKAAKEPVFLQKIPIILGPLKETVAKAEKAIKLSSKSPFDLSMLDSDMANLNFQDDDLDAITVTASDFQQQLKGIKKAIQKGDEFELERAMRAIEKDLQAQIAAAEDLANQTANPFVRDEMLKRVNYAKSELEGLMGKLRNDATAALQTKDVSRIQEILQGVEKMFGLLAEGKALNELQTASHSLDALLKEIPKAVAKPDGPEARALCKDVAKEIELLKLMSNIIADQADDDFRKNRILKNVAAMEALNKQLTPSVNDTLEGVPKSKEKMDAIIADLRKLNQELNSVASVSTPQELLEKGRVVNQALIDLRGLCPLVATSGFDQSLVENKLKDIVSNIKPEVTLAKEWAAAQMIEDPNFAKDVIAKADALQKATGKLAVDSKALLANPTQAAALKSALASVDKVSDANKQLLATAIENTDEMLDSLIGKVRGDGTVLKAAAIRGDIPDMVQGMATLKADFKDALFLADLMGLDLEDQKLKDDLLRTSADLAGLLNGLVPTTKALAKAPKAPKPNDDYDSFMNNLCSGLDQISTITDACAPEDLLISNANKIVKTAKGYAGDMEKNQPAKAEAKMKSEKKKVAKQIQLGEQVAARCETVLPALADKISAEVRKLDKLTSDLEKAGIAVKANPTDQEAKKKLKAAHVALAKQAQLTAQLAQDIKQGKIEAEKKAIEVARLAAEQRKREEEEKKKKIELAMPEVCIKEIFVAASEVTNITQNLEADGSAAGTLVALANKLAAAMQELSVLSKTGTRQDLIALGRKIADMVSDIMKHIDAACANCRDPILCQEMRDMGHCAKNFAIQLKIICGVKASLIFENDPDAATSLITSCQGMCRSVGDVVKLSQIAKLKPKK